MYGYTLSSEKEKTDTEIDLLKLDENQALSRKLRARDNEEKRVIKLCTGNDSEAIEFHGSNEVADFIRSLTRFSNRAFAKTTDDLETVADMRYNKQDNSCELANVKITSDINHGNALVVSILVDGVEIADKVVAARFDVRGRDMPMLTLELPVGQLEIVGHVLLRNVNLVDEWAKKRE